MPTETQRNFKKEMQELEKNGYKAPSPRHPRKYITRKGIGVAGLIIACLQAYAVLTWIYPNMSLNALNTNKIENRPIINTPISTTVTSIKEPSEIQRTISEYINYSNEITSLINDEVPYCLSAMNGQIRPSKEEINMKIYKLYEMRKRQQSSDKIKELTYIDRKRMDNLENRYMLIKEIQTRALTQADIEKYNKYNSELNEFTQNKRNELIRVLDSENIPWKLQDDGSLTFQY